jgi:two-component system alkaline phosphatase synthesis response regulator PhoP
MPVMMPVTLQQTSMEQDMDNKQKRRILIVDDDSDIQELLSYNLRKEGYEVKTAGDGKDAVAKAAEFRPDLILLDVMMPEMDGIETCRELRINSDLDETMIAFLTARGEDYSQIAGFEAGADDYISKPVKPRVLVSRVNALMRRKSGSDEVPAANQHGDIIIDQEKYLVTKGGVELQMPKKEFELLSLLMSKPGRVFTREIILSQIWGNDVVVGDRTIDVHIRKLREKVGDSFIKTVKGVGYKIDA